MGSCQLRALDSDKFKGRLERARQGKRLSFHEKSQNICSRWREPHEDFVPRRARELYVHLKDVELLGILFLSFVKKIRWEAANIVATGGQKERKKRHVVSKARVERRGERQLFQCPDT